MMLGFGLFASFSLATFAAPNLTGRWETPFIAMPLGIGVRHISTFNGDVFHRDVHLHIENPTFGQQVDSFNLEMKYTIPSVVDANKNIYALDATVVKFERTSLNDASVNYNNENAVCGFTNWILGVPKDVTGVVCEEDEEPFYAGERHYTILQLNGSTMLLGVDSSDTPETRPTRLETKNVFTKTDDEGLDK